jgi:ferredoxin
LVTFARSGLSTDFDSRWGSLLELAEACDVPTRFSCRTGVCQTCRTPLLGGEVRYVNEPLLPPPPDEVLICSAQPDGDVVLDM